MNTSARLRFAALLLSAALVAACRSSDPGGGTVQVGLTDAAGDFLSYTVDVTSLVLTKADGTEAQTLPQRTRVDLAQLVDLTEFVTSATVEFGSYVSAMLVLDYSQADIRVDDGSGNPVAVPLANIKDAQGATIAAPVSMRVRFDNARQLVVAPALPALVDLDFNLAASNAVDLTVPASPVVTVAPLLVADVTPDSPKPHRIRGPLDQVNLQAGSFTLILRPFNLIQGDHGRLTFVTDASTAFEIDQIPTVGSAGLAQLAAKARLTTGVVAVGTLLAGTRQFLATEVRAGTSVAFGTSDVLTGNVTARSGNTLTVRGAELFRTDGTLAFGDTVSVTVGAATKVIKQGTPGAFSIADISVGQRITVFGTLAGTSMNATGGLARLLLTQLNGTVGSVSGGAVGLTLERIDGHPVTLFDFNGTGTPGNDADPAAYAVATGALPLTGIGAGVPVKARGFVLPFGQASAAADFSAVTVINTANSPATLVVGWPLLQATPFTALLPGSMTLNLAGTGLRDVFRDGVDTTLLATDAPIVQSANQGRGLFAIGTNGSVQVFTQFGAYQQALQSNLGAGLRARAFVASGGAGSYADATKTLTAGAMAAVLQ
jgi:uncharacterized protein DUF4382